MTQTQRDLVDFFAMVALVVAVTMSHGCDESTGNVTEDHLRAANSDASYLVRDSDTCPGCLSSVAESKQEADKMKQEGWAVYAIYPPYYVMMKRPNMSFSNGAATVR